MIQLSKHLKAVNQGDNDSIIYTGNDGGTQTILFNGDGITINGIVATGAGILGTAPTPVSTRTNNPIVGTNTVNANIDALDAAIGADNTPVVRTNNPTVANTVLNAKIQALDTAIGTDAQLTVVTRTTGQLAVDSSIMTKFDVLDAGIGFDAQLSGTKRNISASNTIYQNLDALDSYKTVRTVKKTVGGPAASGTDFKFTSEAGHAAQHLNLGAIVPVKCKILDVEVVCTATLVGNADITMAVGNASGGAQFVVAASCKTLNQVVGSSDALLAPLQPMNFASATSIWLDGDPSDNNWSDMTAGTWAVYVTFIDLLNV